MRNSKVFIRSDDAGEFETELFEAENPSSVVICSHGNGVRRWDGEHFFHNVAEHYPDKSFYLVDQNQVIEGGCSLNELQIMISRVQELITLARQTHPRATITVLAHSMGCGIATKLDLREVKRVVFVAPAAGNVLEKLAQRYGKGIATNGGMTKTSDGLNKLITKEYVDSIRGIIWETEYEELLNRFPEVYVFESGEEEIVGEERLKHKGMSFKDFKVISGATHNLKGKALEQLFQELDALI